MRPMRVLDHIHTRLLLLLGVVVLAPLEEISEMYLLLRRDFVVELLAELEG